MLDWDDLRYFLALHRTGTLAGAARKLKVDQTTVGRRITSAEAALGVQLFVRRARTFVLTPAGEGVLPTAEQVEQAMLSLARAVHGGDDRLQGTVRIGAAEAVAHRAVLPALTRLDERYPDIRVELVPDGPGAHPDVAVRIGGADEFGDSRRLCDVSFGMYGSIDYLRRRGTPKHLRDLEGHDLVGYEDGSTPGARWLESVTPPARCNFRAGGTLLVAAAAAAGIGLAVLPCFVGETEAGLCRVAPDETIACLGLWVQVPKDAMRLARVAAVLRTLEASVASRAGVFRGDPPAPLPTRPQAV